MEQQKVTLHEFLDMLEGEALGLLSNIRMAKGAAKQQAATIETQAAKVKELEERIKALQPPLDIDRQT